MQKSRVVFSIIIPVKQINDYIKESIPHILNQSNQDFEVIILPDIVNEKINNKKIKIIPTGQCGPAEKRDLGAKIAKGEILAFIDDDAYPEKDWLKNALETFRRSYKIGAVGGPNLTPKNASFFEKVAGNVLGSAIISGPASARYKVQRFHESDDLPSCNLLIRKSVFDSVSGFDSSWWPGEDTKICRDIILKGSKIIYDPKVIVFHHRRNTLKGHLKQVFNYSKHRGYFMKRLPENSLKISYFIPTFFVLGLIIGGILSIFSNAIFLIYLSVLALYFIILFLSSLSGSIVQIPFFIVTGFLTHITYGIGLIVGLLKPQLRSKYRK